MTYLDSQYALQSKVGFIMEIFHLELIHNLVPPHLSGIVVTRTRRAPL
jgi:hypothetical protein